MIQSIYNRIGYWLNEKVISFYNVLSFVIIEVRDFMNEMLTSFAYRLAVSTAIRSDYRPMILTRKHAFRGIAVFLVLIVGYVFSSYSGTWYVRAPELFGEGQAYIFNVGDRQVGYINAWGQWVLYGRYEDCRIVQVGGQPIQNAENPVPCYMRFNHNNKFIGWIDFRGHTRPYCGTPGYDRDKLPPKCYGE